MRSLAVLLLLGVCACAGEASVASAPSAPAAPARPAPSAAATPPGDHALARSTVRAVVADGLGSFLQHVEVDDQPVMSAGKFHGFRIAALPDAAFWSGVDLKPGDVVTAVNGFPIEHPEQAQTAFESLEVASELRVAIERDGQPREIVYAIVDGR